MNILFALAVFAAGFLVLVRFLEGTSVFFPSRVMNNTPDQVGLAYEDVYFKTSDGVKLNGWLVKGNPSGATVVFAHGNAGNISGRLYKLNFFYQLGFNAFIFDYRGYGKSEGKPSEDGIYRDAQAAYDYLASRGDLEMKRVIGYGASLGGSVIIDLALHRSLAAIVVDSSFTSAMAIAKRFYPMIPSWMLAIKFDSIGKIKQLAMPKLFIHSPQDETVPYTMGRQLFDAAREPKEFLQSQGGHNDAGIVSDPKAIEQFVSFLNKHQLL